MAEKKSKLKIRSVIFAEDVRQEINGKHSVIGMFAGNIQATTKEVKLPKIVFRIEFILDQEERAVSINFSVTAPSGKTIFESPEPLILHTKPNQPGVAIIGWGPALFKEKGVYEIRFGIDGPAEKVGTFDVHLADA